MSYMPEFLKIQKKDIAVTTKLTRNEYDQLKEYCDRYDLSMSFVIRRLIDDLLMHFKK